VPTESHRTDLDDLRDAVRGFLQVHSPSAAVRTVMRSGGWSLLTELFTCQLIAAAWLGAVFFG